MHDDLVPFAFLLALAAPAVGQDFDLTVDGGASASDVLASFAAELPSTVIGDYDAVNNPGGTRTLPGLFGGSGNQPVAWDLTLSGVTDFLASPTGSLAVGVDLPGLGIDVAGLDLDLLGGTTETADLVATVLFQTFRTFQPDSLFVGGVPVDLPLGAQALSEVRLVQSAPSVGGTLAATADPDRFTFTVDVPADLSFLVDLQGTPTPVGPLPLLVPLSGEILLAGGALTWSAALDLQSSTLVIDPLPGFTIDDQPFDVPTILPPGFTAHLLLSAVVASIHVDLDLSLDLVASGGAACGFELYCDATANSSGAPASIAIAGSADVTDEDLTLTVTGLPVDEFGYFLMSESRANVPGFGGSEGILCVGAPQIRFSGDVLGSGAGGAVSFSPDFGALPQGVVFTAGSTWNFQLWYRDGQTSNTSGGATVAFCP